MVCNAVLLNGVARSSLSATQASAGQLTSDIGFATGNARVAREAADLKPNEFKSQGTIPDRASTSVPLR